MRYLFVIFFLCTFIFNTNAFAGSNGSPLSQLKTDNATYQLYSFFDLRDRESFIQVTSPNSQTTVHFQVFDVGNLCTENNFFDTYTPNDTHVYNMRDIQTNNGNTSGISLPEDAYGFVVVTAVPGIGLQADQEAEIIGNFRIIDGSGYEYRTNSLGPDIFLENESGSYNFNFNQAEGVNSSDVIGITLNNITSGEVSAAGSSLLFNTTLYNDNEVPFSCSDTVFSCTADTFEYGINNALPSSKNKADVCGSNNIQEGIVVLDLISNNSTEAFAGYVGLNNGNGRGSMDSMWTENIFETEPMEELVEICGDGIDNDGINGTDCVDIACDGSVIDTGGGPFMCEPTGESSCEDGFDNDQNDFMDCADLGCDGSIVNTGGGSFECEPDGETLCEDGFDNDGDDLIDTDDPDCPEPLMINQQSFDVCITNADRTITGSVMVSGAASCTASSASFRSSGGVFINNFIGDRPFSQNGDIWSITYTLGSLSPTIVRQISITYSCTDFQGNTMNAGYNPQDFTVQIGECN